MVWIMLNDCYNRWVVYCLGKYLMDNSLTVPLCQSHYRLITLYFLVVFTTVDKRFDREDGGNWLQEVYSITIIYDFILTFPLCLKDISNFTPRQKFPYVRKSYFVSHEIHFRMVKIFLASTGQNYEWYLIRWIFQGFPNLKPFVRQP